MDNDLERVNGIVVVIISDLQLKDKLFHGDGKQPSLSTVYKAGNVEISPNCSSTSEEIGHNIYWREVAERMG